MIQPAVRSADDQGLVLEVRLLRVVRVGLAGERAFVCFSGGIDSSIVLKACVEAGAATTALLAVSPSLAEVERKDAHRVAAEIGAPLVELSTQELSAPEYRANRGDRCYYCKLTLYREATRVASAHAVGSGRLLNGTHLDDLGEHRPGLVASDEQQVLSPLVVAEFDKLKVRALANYWGLTNSSKPAMPCLASRIPAGTEVTAERLSQVEHVENFLRVQGMWPARARWRQDGVTIEVPPDLRESARAHVFSEQLRSVCASAGFQNVSIVDGITLRR